jgi:hypothetical protein
MRKQTRNVRSTDKIKAGIQCPACEDIIFSLYTHDFRRCICGKVFIDGGDDYMRCGAEPPVDPQEIRNVYRPQREAERMMGRAARAQIKMAPPPPPLSFFTHREKYQVLWHWETGLWSWPKNLGPYPKAGKFIGGIYRWIFVCGPLELRRWETEKH